MPRLRYCARCLTTFESDPDRCTNLACARAQPAGGWDSLLEPGDVLDRHYRIEQPLALGGAGLTYRARELDGEGRAFGPELAVKVLYAQRDQGSFLRRLSNEAQILQELDHPHIVECRGFVHRAGHAPYLVTLFEHGGNLGGHLEEHGPLSPRVSAGALRQVLLALHTAHRRGVIHRDLKPENVLLRQRVPPDEIPECRVADFGIAKVEALMGRVTRQGAFVGTPEFAAPEQFEGRDPTPATDVYAAGALFYALLTGRDVVNFSDRLDVERCLDELVAHLPPAAPDTIADPDERALCQAILDGMTRVEPGDRWDVPKAVEALGALVDGRAPQALADLRRPQPAPAPHDDDDGDGDDLEGAGFGAALFGVGAPLLALVVAIPAVAVALLAAAWGFGHFEGAPDPAGAALVGTVQVRALSPEPPRDLAAASDPASTAERAALVRALSGAAGRLPAECGLEGRQTFGVRIGGAGRIQQLTATGLTDTERRCAARVLREAPLVRTTRDDVTIGLALTFPG